MEDESTGEKEEIKSVDNNWKTKDCKEKRERTKEDQDSILDVHIREDVYKEVQELLKEESIEDKRIYKSEKNKTNIRNWFKSTEIPKKIKEEAQSQRIKENDNKVKVPIEQRGNYPKRKRR